MYKCPKCHKTYDHTWRVCLDCRIKLEYLSSEKQYGLSVESVDALFKDKFTSTFLPEDGFYDGWAANDERLNRMKTDVFNWLQLDPKIVSAKFEDKLNGAGLYVADSNNPAIYVNRQNAKDPFCVGAIMAHECMHHYMVLNSMNANDRLMNELKTDLSTISAGLGLLVVNGMKMRRYWHLTALLMLVGQYYYKESKRSVGYFTANAYCNNFAEYLSRRQFNKKDILRYVHPLARHFLPRELKRVHCKSRTKALDRENLIYKLNKAFQVFSFCCVAAVFGTIIYLGNEEGKKEIIAKNELKAIASQLKVSESNLENYDSRIRSVDEKMEFYRSVSIDKYNEMVRNCDDLRAKAKDEYAKYRNLISEYNAKVDKINKHRY